MRAHFEVNKTSKARPILDVRWPPNSEFPPEIKMALPFGNVWLSVKEAEDLSYALAKMVRLARPDTATYHDRHPHTQDDECVV